MKYRILEINDEPSYMMIIYIGMAIFGGLGNIVTCVVIAKNKNMHTTTNLYLFNLAVSDTMILIWACPLMDSYTGYNHDISCISRALLAETSVYASILTISAFTIERYIAVCYPLQIFILSKKSRVLAVIPFIWVIALLSASPLAFQLGVVRHSHNHNLTMCTLVTRWGPLAVEISSFVFFFVPMILISVMYLLIWLKLRKSEMMRKNCTRIPNISKSTDTILRMLVVVVCLFFACWVPFHVQRILAVSFKQFFKTKSIEFRYSLFQISGLLYYSSAVINPIIYNVMSWKYRNAFKKTLRIQWASER